MRINARELNIEEAKAVRKNWIKSILEESTGFFALNNYTVKLGLTFGEDAGRAFRQKIRQIQWNERRKLSFEEITAIYEDFERKLKGSNDK